MLKEKKKKISLLNINKRDNLSCFIIDLKEKADKLAEKQKPGLAFFSVFRKKFEFRKIKLFFFNFSNFKIKAKIFFSPLSQIVLASILKFFFFSAKYIGRGAYKLCYFTGWLAVYGFRISYFSGRKIILAPIKIIFFFKNFLNYFFINFKKIVYSRLFFAIKEWRREKFFPRPELKLLRPAFFFFLILILLVLPFKLLAFYKDLNLGEVKENILGAGEEAAFNLKEGAESAKNFDFNEAGENFSRSAEKFIEAQNELGNINNFLFILSGLIPEENFRLASQSRNILAAGEKASILARDLSLAMGGLSAGEKNIIGIIDNFIKQGEEAVKDGEELDAYLKKIDVKALPEEYRKQFQDAKEKTELASASLSEFVDIVKKFKLFLGANENKKYLLVFQNNAEMRATGGFIGSFAVVDFSAGKIKNIEAPGGGSYDTEGGMKIKVRAPEPLWLVNPLWHFWDANWFPDWPLSARKLEWFYEKSDGPTVDGVIALTPTVMEDLLKIIGPIDMKEKYGLEISAENFWLETQRLAEQKPDKTKEPKKIIGDLMQKIIEILPAKLNKDGLPELIKTIEKSLSAKQILFYFNDPELENKISEYGWDGKIKESSHDYLMVINTNIAGGKSDRKISQTISHKAEISADGSIVDAIKIERRHNGEKNEEFSGVRNVNWLRVYTPKGSELLEASGFSAPDQSYFSEPDPDWIIDKDVNRAEKETKIHETSKIKIYNESEKTVFAGWTMVDPGQTAIINLKYKLPFKIEKKEDKEDKNLLKSIKGLFYAEEKKFYAYSLLSEKQAGSLAVKINTDLILPTEADIVWRYPKGARAEKSGWQIREELSSDKYWAVIFEK
jgi:hypothetical protein